MLTQLVTEPDANNLAARPIAQANREARTVRVVLTAGDSRTVLQPEQQSVEALDPWQVDADLAAAGDRVAFERLYRGHMLRVFSICMRMVNDRTRAEELTQDVFVRVWQKLPTYRGDSAVSTWLHRVTVNVVLTDQKSRGAKKNVSAGDDEVVELAAARPVHIGDRLDLDAAIASLPRGARQIFVLHDVEGFTHDEIGEQLGISAGGSKAQLHRARMLLRQALSR